MSRVNVFAGSLVAVVLAAGSVSAQSYNAAVVQYCESKVGQRVGSGECAHLATEALRVAGAEFTRVDKNGNKIADKPGDGDYVWGELIWSKEISGGLETGGETVGKRVRPGDVIQYRGARFADGSRADHHTSIVAEVDGNGNPTRVYEQNFGKKNGNTGGRVVRKGSINVKGLQAGRLMIYRPTRATNPFKVQITLRNEAKAGDVSYKVGSQTRTIGGQNTAGGFQTSWGDSTAVEVDGKAYPVSSRKAYEFYTMGNGKVGLREVK